MKEAFGRAAAVLALSRITVKSTLRDRTALFFFAILPLAVITLIGVVFHVDDGQQVLVVDHDRTAASQDLLTQFRADTVLDVRVVRSEAEASRAVRTQRAAAAVVVPAGLQQRLATGTAGGLDLLVLRTDAVPRAVRLAIIRDVDRFGDRWRAASAGSRATGAPLATALHAARHAADDFSTHAEITPLGGGGRAVAGLGFVGPANLVLFMFANVLGTSRGLVAARANGALVRAAHMKQPPSVLLLGEATGRFALSLIQAALIVTVGVVVFGISWGPAAGVAAVVCLFSICAASASLLLAALAKTESQAFLLAPVVGLSVGMLGGCLWPLSTVGAHLRSLGHALPTSWALDALLDLGASGMQWPRFLGQLTALAAFSAVLFVGANVAFRRNLTRERA